MAVRAAGNFNIRGNPSAMQSWLKKQLTNIVFLVLIVAAALTIYLLSRTSPPAASATVRSDTPAPAPTASATAAPRGVPEAVFKTHLQSSELYQAEASPENNRAWTLAIGGSPEVGTQLLYAVDGGCVSSLEISFRLPRVYEDEGDTGIDRFLYEASQMQSDAVPDAVRVLLGDLLPASDAEDRLNVVTARYWAEQALLLEKQGDDFKDTQSGCRFIALRTERNDSDVLVCTLFFE